MVKNGPTSYLTRRDVQTTIPQESIVSEGITTTIQHIKIEKLLPFKGQSRLYFDEKAILDLANSIKEHGIRSPLTIIVAADEKNYGKYEVVSGERRLRACTALGFERVPCIIINDYEKAEEIALVENIQRDDLHPIELGHAYHQLSTKKIGYSQEKIADKLGVPRTQVAEYIKFSKISRDVAESLIKHKITSRRVLREIAAAEYSQQLTLLHEILDQKQIPGNILEKKVGLVKIYYVSGSFVVDKKNLQLVPKEVIARLSNEIVGIQTELTSLMKYHEESQ